MTVDRALKTHGCSKRSKLVSVGLCVRGQPKNPTRHMKHTILYFQINQYRDALDAHSRANAINAHARAAELNQGNAATGTQLPAAPALQDIHPIAYGYSYQSLYTQGLVNLGSLYESERARRRAEIG
ncbi:hypothetical protein BJV77DRAFT_513935 [Russula vinacea]|nr:hypothetical protein BJV77DRAFT_513935 [Russula vinacea]